MNPVLCFIRARLHRRMFLWFGATILFTGMAVAFVMGAAGGGATGWKREAARAHNLVGDVFAGAWDSPQQRDALARTVSQDLDATVILESASGVALASYGGACGGKPMTLPITRGGEILGRVSICADRYRTSPFQIALPLFVTLAILWAASGKIAHRLAQPMAELARVAHELGSGNFTARARLGRHHHHGEAAALALTINNMASRIERHLAEQRELLAAVSHELRTPLARIRLITELGRDKGDGVPNATFDDLDREVVEMDALVGDLLASSRLDFAVLSRRPINAVEATARALERAGVDAGVLSAGAEGDIEPLRVEADATLLARALANLVDNARKHGGGIENVRVRRDGAEVAIEVEDHGAGFIDGEEARIFEPFYRRSEQGSLGLGLSLVKRIAEAHGGRAYAENRVEGGARVAIALPIAASA
ncbi:MAG: HAMP domain-containing sensor histidine kinase [Byssovorax sp.]